MVSLSGLPGNALPKAVIDTVRDLDWQDSLAMVSDTTADLAAWKNAAALDAALAADDARSRTLTSCFLLHEPVASAALEHALTDESVRTLLDAGVLSNVGDGRLISDYLLVRVEGLALFASWRAAEREGGTWNPWIGPDSVMLTRLIRARRPARAIDLGCGTGVLGLHAADVGAEVVAVDVEQDCVRATQFNAALNRLDDRVETRLADLTSLEAHREYDLVVSNPPFFPVPVGALNFTAAEAGWDGLDLFRQIMDFVAKAMSDRGETLMLAAGYGDANGPFVASELEEFFAKHGLSGRLTLMKPIPARWPVMTVRRYRDVSGSVELSRAVGDYIRSIGATHYHPFVLSCRRSTTPALSVVPSARTSAAVTTAQGIPPAAPR